jgi:4-alpha-glucanotransferase
MSFSKRGSGVLLHVTSLPSACGIGDLGPEAYRFADFLSDSRQGLWQILPLNPTELFSDSSPYHSTSAFAGNPLFISPELLLREGYLTEADREAMPDFPRERVDFDAVVSYKRRLFPLAYENFKKKENEEYESFCAENAFWLEDFALFVSLKKHFQGRVWSDWPIEIRDRETSALQGAKEDFSEEMEMQRFLQFVFSKQWSSLKDYCCHKGIRILGDLPVYVVYDSVDVWKNPGIFKLDEKKKPYAVAGVPPDYFSKTGQLWGNPVYDWEVLKEKKYEWWLQRLEHNLRLYDVVRIDHFRGFVAYWEVLATEKTAINGKWVEAPAEDFFHQITEKLDYHRIVAEDLGTITPDVIEVKERFGFTGMKVLLFAFGDDFPKSSYLPHNVEKNCIFYTGTHDNNTVKGWFQNEATPEMKKRVSRYVGHKITEEEISWEFIRLAMRSAAHMVIVPMQDILNLGEESRMNRPATKKGNWRWRLLREQISPSLSERLGDMTETCERA